MLSEIGNYTEKMGKETRHQVPNLPTHMVQDLGGYHANAINADTHNLFEEVIQHQLDHEGQKSYKDWLDMESLQTHSKSTVKAEWKNLTDTFRREFRKIPILRSGDSGGTLYEVPGHIITSIFERSVYFSK
ncbi:hypothetical protein QE152_g38603 [Popillia japonica]|uniref:Uncharacterized protein n=1 Tax=Popillia japonica TaxID=7064 RepID=A0AAW1HX17_POPJA